MPLLHSGPPILILKGQTQLTDSFPPRHVWSFHELQTYTGSKETRQRRVHGLHEHERDRRHRGARQNGVSRRVRTLEGQDYPRGFAV